MQNRSSRAQAQAATVNSRSLALIAAVSITVAVLVGLSTEKMDNTVTGLSFPAPGAAARF